MHRPAERHTRPNLERVIESLRKSSSVRGKIAIREAYEPATAVTLGAARIGDDCAAIRDPAGGWLLLAAEGMLESFVRDDPWFAGYSAVMVNVSDVAAMGGRPMALVDVLWTPDHAATAEAWEGMRAASAAYGVPLVGGHTTLTGARGNTALAAAILGRARRLLTSFDARPGDRLLSVVDLDGEYRRDWPFWNASTRATPERLRCNIDLLARVAEADLCTAGKDVSNGGIVGTLVMLLEASGVGARLDLARLPRPAGVDLERWLTSFPSYGFLLTAPPASGDRVIGLFESHGLPCDDVGCIVADPQLVLELDGEASCFWEAPQKGEVGA